MKVSRIAVLSAGLVAAAIAAPVAHGQTKARIVSPQRADVFTFAGGSRIGVSISDVDAADVKAKGGGVRVDEVESDSPASKAGFRQGDIIAEFDGERVRSVRQFSRLVSETPPGRTVSAAVLRDGSRTTLTVTPREGGNFRLFDDGNFRVFEDGRHWTPRPTPAPRVPTPPSPPRAPVPPVLENFTWTFGGNRLGVTIEDLSPQLADYFGAKDGVLVSSVETDSAAAKAGVKAGDVITSVNGSTVNDGGDLRRTLARLSAGDEFSLGIVRDKRTMTVKGKVEGSQERRRSRTIL